MFELIEEFQFTNQQIVHAVETADVASLPKLDQTLAIQIDTIISTRPTSEIEAKGMTEFLLDQMYILDENSPLYIKMRSRILELTSLAFVKQEN